MVAFAPRAAAGRGELRAAEAEVAGGVIDLQAVHERADLLAEREAPVVCPYKGLATFDVADAEYFFGRERLVAELVARLVGAPLLGVVGPSGSGKSSVVRAGLLPALAGGVLPGSDAVAAAASIRPGEHPMRELRSARSRRRRPGASCWRSTSSRRLFTACRDEAERAAFIDALVRAAARPHGGARRARRPRRLLRPLRRLSRRCRSCSAPTTCSWGRCAATSCAERSSGRRNASASSVEPELVDALVADVEGEPGRAAAAVHRAARAVAASATGGACGSRRTSARGGVRGAVARLAEEAYGAARRRRAGACANGSCCGSPARARAARSFAGASRWRSSRAGQ